MKIDAFKIETLLAENGLTKKDLSVKCGVSAQNISTIVHRGTCEPRTAWRLSDCLSVVVGELLLFPVSEVVFQQIIEQLSGLLDFQKRIIHRVLDCPALFSRRFSDVHLIFLLKWSQPAFVSLLLTCMICGIQTLRM